MTKRIAVAGVVLVAMLVVGGLMSSAASAEFSCYLVSGFVSNASGGNWSTGTCMGAEVTKLTGRWILAELTSVIPGSPALWCALTKLVAGNTNTENGFYKNTATHECKEQLLPAESNKSDLTDVIVPLPTIHTALPGEVYPLDLGGHLQSKSELLEEGGGKLEGKEESILLSVAELTSLGTAVIDFLGVEEPKEKAKCNTPGDSEANGAVLIPGAEYHLVYTNFEPLEIGALILFNKFIILCNSGTLEDVTVGPSTARVSVPASEAGHEGDISFLNTASHCFNKTAAAQEIPYYYNNEGLLTPTTLLANLSGTGLKKSCEEIEGTLLVAPETGSSATMFTVLY